MPNPSAPTATPGDAVLDESIPSLDVAALFILEGMAAHRVLLPGDAWLAVEHAQKLIQALRSADTQEDTPDDNSLPSDSGAGCPLPSLGDAALAICRGMAAHRVLLPGDHAKAVRQARNLLAALQGESPPIPTS